MPWLDSVFAELPKKKASDLHLAADAPLKVRILGELEVMDERPIPMVEVVRIMKELVSADDWERFQKAGELDFGYGLPGTVRLRAHYFIHHGGPGAVFRTITNRVPQLHELKLPAAISKLASLRRGLVLVTGPTGCGKSTTLAALIDAINSRSKRHIITIEEPVEYVHQDRHSIIVQREVGKHVASFSAAVRAAVRQDPDVILVGEMRDPQTMALALEAARTGFLVFGTLHTNGAAKAIDRIVDFFSPERQNAIRQTMAATLRAVVSQLLLRDRTGRARYAVAEILMVNQAAQTLIREGKVAQLYSLMQRSSGEGMITMDQALLKAVQSKRASPHEAWRRAQDKSLFEAYTAPTPKKK